MSLSKALLGAGIGTLIGGTPMGLAGGLLAGKGGFDGLLSGGGDGLGGILPLGMAGGASGLMKNSPMGMLGGPEKLAQQSPIGQIGGLTGSAPIVEQNNLTGGRELIPQQGGNQAGAGGDYQPFSFLSSLFGGN